MCGILGVVGGSERVREAALAALDQLAHRGPDDAGRHVDEGIALGMRRLAIIDLETGGQPIGNETGEIVCVCNGEIYNYVELRRELAGRGHALRTAGDVEVVPHLYEETGLGAFERLRGMFAVALWDARRRRLVLARDRFGIKPLYVADVEGGLAFSSEIGPLLSLGVEPRVDVQAIADYLAFGYVPGAETGLETVRALEPGTVLEWSADGRRTTAYAGIELAAAEEPVEDVLRTAVGLHLRADVPLAVLLSGGLDSSLIASLAAEQVPGRLHTFTVGFGDPRFDERAAARAVAEAIGSEHHEVAVSPDVAADLPAIVARLEEPLADPSAIPLYYVCREVGGVVKVALAGEGGDEVFGGYSRYAWDRLAGRLGGVLPAGAVAAGLARLPGVGRRAARADRRSVVRRAIKLLRHAERAGADRYAAWFALFDEDAKAELLDGAGTRPAAAVFARLLAEAPASATPLGRLQYVDLRSMLEADLLLKADRMSMAHSLELRVPLVDPVVVATGLALPDRRKVRGVRTKVALRELVRRRLPPEIARRPKQGFEVPIDRWLRTTLRELATDVLSPSRLRASGLVEPVAAERLLRAHLDGEADHGLRLYALCVLELWLDRLRRDARAPVAG